MPQPSTVISEKAVGRIVEQALASVPGCIHHASGLDKVTGRELPRWEIDLDSENRAMSIVAQIAVRWPSPVTEVAVSARQALHSWVERYTDIPVIKADVAVAAVVPGDVDNSQPTRVTSEDIAARQHEPSIEAVTASPLETREVTTNRQVTSLLHPKPFGDVTLTPVHVNRTATELIHPQHTRIEPFKDVVAHRTPVMPVRPVHTRKELTPISVNSTYVQSPVTPEPIRPTIYPSVDRTPVVHVDTSAKPRKTERIVTHSRPVEPPLTPTPITPSITPTAKRIPVTHLVGEIGPRRTDPIVVESMPVESVRAYPLKPSPVTVDKTEVTHPKAPETPVDQHKVMQALEDDEKQAVAHARAGWPRPFAESDATKKRKAKEAEHAARAQRRRERDARKIRTVVSPGTVYPSTVGTPGGKTPSSDRSIPVLRRDADDGSRKGQK